MCRIPTGRQSNYVCTFVCIQNGSLFFFNLWYIALACDLHVRSFGALAKPLVCTYITYSNLHCMNIFLCTDVNETLCNLLFIHTYRITIPLDIKLVDQNETANIIIGQLLLSVLLED